MSTHNPTKAADRTVNTCVAAAALCFVGAAYMFAGIGGTLAALCLVFLALAFGARS